MPDRRSSGRYGVRVWLGVLIFALLCAPGFGERVTPTEVVRQTMRLYFTRHLSFSDTTPQESSADQSYQSIAQRFTLAKNYAQPRGVFVTLSHQGKPRACWGSAFPQYKTVLEATVYATLGALTKEYRYRPIQKGEWPSLKPQVTVVKALEPVDSLAQINPLRDGLLVRQGGKSGVMLPGEARDATYQLVQCKLKAGIRPNEKFQMYRIVADVYQ